MTLHYAAFDPNMLHSPLPFGIRAITGRDKLGAHRIFQQSSYRSVRSFSAADAAHVGCTHLTHLSICDSSAIPVPLRRVSGVTLSIWLLWELRCQQGRPCQAIPNLH